MLFKQVQTVTAIIMVFVSAGVRADQIAQDGHQVAGASPQALAHAGRCVVSPQCLYVKLTPAGEPMPIIDLDDAKKMACENTFMRCDQEKITEAYNLRNDGQRVSPATGAIFTRDTSNPALGEAYRDPSGLIWSQVVAKSPKDGAPVHCEYRNARLPTEDELIQLSKYLGYGTKKGYSPYLADGKTEILRGLSKTFVWSSTQRTFVSSLQQVLRGWDGDVFPFESRYTEGVICVSGR